MYLALSGLCPLLPPVWKGFFLKRNGAYGQLLWHSGACRSSTVASGSPAPAPDVQRDTAELVRSLVLR